jgi:hypothetical protein
VRVLSEEKLITYLERVVELSAKVLPLLSAQGTEPPPAKLVKAYQAIVDDLAAERATDEQLQELDLPAEGARELDPAVRSAGVDEPAAPRTALTRNARSSNATRCRLRAA